MTRDYCGVRRDASKVCECIRVERHKGPHTCDCTAQWDWSLNNKLVVVRAVGEMHK